MIKNFRAVFGAIVTTFVPPKSEPLSLRFITENIPVCTLLCPEVGLAARIVKSVVKSEAVKISRTCYTVKNIKVKVSNIAPSTR